MKVRELIEMLREMELEGDGDLECLVRTTLCCHCKSTRYDFVDRANRFSLSDQEYIHDGDYCLIYRLGNP